MSTTDATLDATTEDTSVATTGVPPAASTEAAPGAAAAVSPDAPAPRARLTRTKEEVLASLAEAKEAILKAQEVGASEGAQVSASPVAHATPSPTPAAPASVKVEPQPLVPPDLEGEGSGPNARKYRRVNVNVRAKMVQAGRPPEDARLCDLSMGGLGLITERNIPMAAVCHVKFRLTMPSGVLFTVVAAAQTTYSAYSAHHHGFKTGMRFGKLPEPAIAAITEFIADKTKTQAL